MDLGLLWGEIKGSAKVFVSPHSYFHRPLNLLYPIECPSEGNDDVSKQNSTQNTESNNENETVTDVPIEDDHDNEEIKERRVTHGVNDLMSSVTSARLMRKATIVTRRRIKEWLSLGVSQS